MPNLPKEIQEFSILVQELASLSKKLSEYQISLIAPLNDFEGEDIPERLAQSRIENTLAIKLVETLHGNQTILTDLYDGFKQLSECKELQIIPAQAMEKRYVYLFLLLKSLKEKKFFQILQRTKKAAEKIRRIVLEANIDISKIPEIVNYKDYIGIDPTQTEFWEKCIRQDKELVLFLFGEKENILLFLSKYETVFLKIINHHLLKNAFKACRRNHSLVIRPEKIDSQLRGKISVKVRHGIDIKEEVTRCAPDYIKKVDNSSLEKFMKVFIEKVESSGSIEKYYSTLYASIESAIALWITLSKTMLISVFGDVLKFTLFIDIQPLDSRGCVGEYKEKIKSQAYDHYLKSFEINIGIAFLWEQIIKQEIPTIATVIIHEFNHLLDQKIQPGNYQITNESNFIRNLNSVRNEGIACFSQWIAGKELPWQREKLQPLITSLYSKPIKDFGEYYPISMEYGKEGLYLIGKYICLVFYLGSLKRKNPGYLKLILSSTEVLDPLNEKTLSKLREIEEARAVAHLTLSMLRQLNTKQFFYYYFKYAKELSLTPIIDEKFIGTVVK